MPVREGGVQQPKGLMSNRSSRSLPNPCPKGPHSRGLRDVRVRRDSSHGAPFMQHRRVPGRHPRSEMPPPEPSVQPARPGPVQVAASEGGRGAGRGCTGLCMSEPSGAGAGREAARCASRGPLGLPGTRRTNPPAGSALTAAPSGVRVSCPFLQSKPNCICIP